MNQSGSLKDRRNTCAAIAVLILVITLFSAFYIGAEAHHTCSGEDCPVCATIELCEHTLRRLSDGAVALIAVIVPVVSIFLSLIVSGAPIPAETLITRKIRLNN